MFQITWVAFLMGEVGLICKLNNLDVTWILIYHVIIRNWYWYLVSV